MKENFDFFFHFSVFAGPLLGFIFSMDIVEPFHTFFLGSSDRGTTFLSYKRKCHGRGTRPRLAHSHGEF